MKYLGIYIKDRKMYFLLTAFICGVTAVINYLYSAPLQAGIYAFKISLTVLVIVCAADYVHFYKKHENLQRHCHLKEVHALEEDAAHTAIERDYQQLVLKLIQEKAQLAEHMQKKQTDMMDYYAIWAHQIKTPIAAVDLLLQVMEENPQEVAEQDIKELKSELFNKELKGQTSMQMQIGTAVNDYQIASYLPEPEMDFGLQAYSGAVKCLLVVVPGKEDVQKWRQQALEAGNMQNLQYCVQYNTNLSKQESLKLTEDLYRIDIESAYVEAENSYEMAEQLYQIYGGLLFVGLFIGILFLMATALIIYYKQISEGYQDKKRFEIMQNVGMSLTEVKKTIRSQVLMVFFLPLVAAGIHIAVSFRIIQMMVRMLAMGETKLFGMCTLITLGIFCVIYGLVYAFTAKSYYNIVRVRA